MPSIRTVGEIAKVDDAKRVVWGWASVYEEAGKAVVDHEGDDIPEEVVLTAAHDFMLEARASKAQHRGDQVGTVIESLVFTGDLQKVLGIDLAKKGWLIAVKIHDDATWAKVKDGTYKAFSIGGRCVREEVAA